jgi:pullulanase/glycogen debranching enzyme
LGSRDAPDNQVGCVIRENGNGALCLLFNAARNSCRFVIPVGAGDWRVVVDTAESLSEARDIIAEEMELEAHTTVVLVSEEVTP